MNLIPFNKPAIGEAEREAVLKALDDGTTAGDGPAGRRCEAMLQEISGAQRALLTTSGTDALEMTSLLVDLKPGDEIIVPSFTFVTTALSFVLRGATPVFADIRPDTLNLDDEKLGDLVSEKTRAILPVHYAGVACEMDAILSLAGDHDLAVIEDNAHGLFGRYKDKPLGSFGDLAVQSFHETKNFGCGEGGALLINDRELITRAEILREKGTDRSRFRAGQVDKYTWQDVGSSYVLSDLLAALLEAQLNRAEDIQDQRAELWRHYHTGFTEWAEDNGVRLPTVPHHCHQAYHMFYMVMPSAGTRADFIAHMREKGIQVASHYEPLHLSPMGRKVGRAPKPLTVTEDVAPRLVRLPLYYDLSLAELARVEDAVKTFKF